MNILFEAKNPLGQIVTCSCDTWFGHIIMDSGHSIMFDNVQNVIATIEKPDVIFRSSQSVSRDVYFKLTPYYMQGVERHFYTKVVVENDLHGSEVVTAWAQSSISGGLGGIVYVKPKL